jgi:RNA polymerase sigma-70 factor, ECF subfamily
MKKIKKDDPMTYDYKSMSEYEKERYIEYLIDTYGEALTRLAYTYVKDFPGSEDIIQEVFLTCFLKLNTIEGNQIVIKNWLYKTTINKCLDYLKSWSNRNLQITQFFQNLITNREDSPELQVVQNTANKEIANLIINLPIKYREVLILFYYEDLSLKEIGEIVNLTPSTLKNRLYRARKMLEKEMIRKGMDPRDQ